MSETLQHDGGIINDIQIDGRSIQSNHEYHIQNTAFENGEHRRRFMSDQRVRIDFVTNGIQTIQLYAGDSIWINGQAYIITQTEHFPSGDIHITAERIGQSPYIEDRPVCEVSVPFQPEPTDYWNWNNEVTPPQIRKFKPSRFIKWDDMGFYRKIEINAEWL